MDKEQRIYKFIFRGETGKMKSILTKKIGDVPVMILVLGVLVVVVLAIFSFAFSLPKYADDFNTIYFIEEANSKVDQYNFYTDSNIDLGESVIENVLSLSNLNIPPYSQNVLSVKVEGRVNGKDISVVYMLG